MTPANRLSVLKAANPWWFVFFLLSAPSLDAAPPPRSAPPAWLDASLRLSAQSSAEHDRAMATLRHLPQLTATLRQELKNTPPNDPVLPTRTFLALDVIAALKRAELLPDLIEFSRTDASGFSYNVMNSLVTPQNRAKMLALYLHRVTEPSTTTTARLILIDTLARFEAPLEVADLRRLQRPGDVLVRSTVLGYIRSFFLRGEQVRYLPLVQEVYRDGNPALRAQVIFMLSESSGEIRERSAAWLKESCHRSDASLQEICGSVR